MKHLILAVVMIAATITSAFADNRPTKADNEAAMKVGRTQLAAKTVELNNSINSHNTALAQSTAANVLDLMRKGMAQTYVKLNLESRDQQKEINKHYLEMERLTHEYQILSQNVPANGAKLVSHAQSFLKEY